MTRRSPEFSCFRNTTLCNKQNDKLGQKVPNDFFKFLTSLQKANIPLLKNWNWQRFLVWQMINTRTMSFSPWKLSIHPLSQSDDNNVKRYTFRKFYRHGYIYILQICTVLYASWYSITLLWLWSFVTCLPFHRDWNVWQWKQWGDLLFTAIQQSKQEAPSHLLNLQTLQK